MNLKVTRSRKREKLVGQKEIRVGNPSNQHTKCARCSGAMIFERFQATVEIFYAWRCLNCGDIMDPVVQKNRELILAQKGQAVGE